MMSGEEDHDRIKLARSKRGQQLIQQWVFYARTLAVPSKQVVEAASAFSVKERGEGTFRRRQSTLDVFHAS
jgi:hypothetical protein